MKILITGATGFVGRVLAQQLLKNGHNLVATCRNQPVNNDAAIRYVNTSSIDGATNWDPFLDGVEVVVHLAGRAHILSEQSADPLEEFRKVNTAGTLNLATCAAKTGIKRFVFLSSIGVNGNQTTKPFDEESPPNPVEPYALSKLEAEKGLRNISENSAMEYVIIRPPLVYGPNSPGNFLALLKLTSRNLPLPFGMINNKRSFIGVDNLADFLTQCIQHSGARNKTFLISDDSDISTPELIRTLAEGMHKKAFLFPVPYQLLLSLTAMIGKSSALEKLCGNLQVDANFARNTLNWKQPVAQSQGLKDTASWYMSSKLGSK